MSPSTLIEFRTAARYSLLQRCLVWPQGPRQAEPWRCIAYNISAGGIAITLPMPCQLGTILQIQAWELPGTRLLQARLVRTSPVEFLWFCGCELIDPLSSQELQQWCNGAKDWLDGEDLV